METTSNEIAADIDDFLWQEILARLPVKSVFLSKCVSKYWHSLISHPYFLHKYLQFHSNSNGDYEDDQNATTILFTQIVPDAVVPRCLGHPSSPFHSKGFSFDFIPVHHLQKQNRFEFVVVSNGWVLCRTATTNGVTYGPCFYPVNYHVCNPLTQQWFDIPLPSRIQTSTATIYPTVGFICEEEEISCNAKPPQFMVTEYLLIFNRMNNIIIQGRTFSSATWQWSDISIIHSHHHPAMILATLTSSLTDRDMMLHYATTRYLYAVHPNSNDFDKTDQHIPLPVGDIDISNPLKHFYLGVCHGHIHFSQLEHLGWEKSVSLSVWKLIKGSDISERHSWSLLGTMEITLSDIASGWVVPINCCSRDLVDVLGFSPLDENIVYLKWGDHIGLVNLKSKKLKRVGELNADRTTFMSFLPLVLPYRKLLMQNSLKTNSNSEASTSNNS